MDKAHLVISGGKLLSPVGRSSVDSFLFWAILDLFSANKLHRDTCSNGYTMAIDSGAVVPLPRVHIIIYSTTFECRLT